jgi:hypothetical protein
MTPKFTGYSVLPCLTCQKPSLTILSGEPKLFTEIGLSGGEVERAFCGDCGSYVDVLPTSIAVTIYVISGVI